MDVAEENTCCQMAHQPSVILMPIHAVLNSVFVEVLQLIVNVTTALTIEQVRPFKWARKSLKNKKIQYSYKKEICIYCYLFPSQFSKNR